jgi:hypothetical protein
MKAQTMLAAAALIGALAMPAVAQEADPVTKARPFFSSAETYRKANPVVVKRNYRASLETGNDGVIETALAHVVRMKMYMQAEDFSDIKPAIDWLAVGGRTPAIRYKAYLAALVIENPNWFKDECCKEYAGSEEMFTALADRLRSTLGGLAEGKYVRPE